MSNPGAKRSIPIFVVACLCLPLAYAQEHKIVVGPSNFDLMDGANALLAGDAEEGVRLTMEGLTHAWNSKERLTGLSNLCGGYILLERYGDALEQCNIALAEDPEYWRARTNRALIYVLTGRYAEANEDLSRAEGISPGARTVIAVREMLRDRVDPVEPIIIIDDRRQLGNDDDAGE